MTKKRSMRRRSSTPAQAGRRSRAPRPPKAPPLDPVAQYARDVLDGRIVAGRAVRLACARHFKDLARQRTAEFPYYWDEAKARRLINFYPDFLVLENGEPFVLPPWLQFVYGSINGWRRVSDGKRRYQHGFLETAKGSGKALALDTPIATPSGWTTMGGLCAGDQVFDDRGAVVTVRAAHEPVQGHDCFEVRFDDGQAIVADAEHLWLTEQRCSRRADGKIASAGVPLRARGQWRRALRTTRQLADTLRYPNGHYESANHSIAVAPPLQLLRVELPIDPYLLGVWLGDGDSDCGRVTLGDGKAEIRDELASAGATLTLHKSGAASRWSVRGLTRQLRGQGLLHDKHIPADYLRASFDQRLALLQGLMDTDGSITAKSGACEFSSTCQRLADGVLELLHTLGIKAAIHESEAKLNGRVVSPLWRIPISPPPELPVFRLPRKAQHHRVRHHRRRLAGDRRIVEVRPVPSVPVRCIAVDSPSRLFLAGRGLIPTHNTPSAGGFGLFLLGFDGESSGEIYSTGFDKDQASIVLNDARRLAETSPDPEFRAEFDVDTYNIAHPSSRSFMRAMSSQHQSKSGPRPSGVLSDEIHEHRNGTVISKAEAGFKFRTQPFGLKLTNSGADRTSYCWQLHQKSLDVLEGTAPDEQWFAYVCHLDPCEKCYSEGYRQPRDGCPDCDDWQDPAVWLKANPALGIVIQEKYLRDQITKALSIPSEYSLIRRLNFCIWTETHQVWIAPDAWAACKVPVVGQSLDGARAAAFDMSEKLDLTSGVVGIKTAAPATEAPQTVEITDVEDEEIITKTFDLDFYIDVIPFFWMPQATLLKRVREEKIPFDVWAREGHLRATPGPVIDYGLIYRQFRDEIGKRYKPQRIGYDPHNATMFALQLRDQARYEVAEIAQGRKLSEAFKLTEALIKLKRIRHDGNPVMAWCVANAEAKRDRYENLWVEKPSPTKRIDGLVAMVMVVSLLMVMPIRKVCKRRLPQIWRPDGWAPAIPTEETRA